MKITLVSLLFLVGLLWPSSTVRQLNHDQSIEFFHKFQFMMTSDQPGAAVGFRLRSPHENIKAKLCFLGQCYSPSRQWQLLATDMNFNFKQQLSLMDENSSWELRTIRIEAGLFNQAHRRIAELRLPASVMKQLEEQSGLIEANQAHDEKLFSKSMERPWSTQWIFPVKSRVTSAFASMREPPQGQPYSHTGVDFHATPDTPVHSCSDGLVVGTDNEVIYGNVVTIDHGNGLMSRYMHLSSFKVNPGDVVKAGDVIGLSGATGRAEAPHLHWEMRLRGRPVDPLSTQRLLVRLAGLE